MESHRDFTDKRAKKGPIIARRSCDQCRARKIGCDRGSPCSNCLTARLSCIHSAVASNTTAPRQRVLISAQYEKKIDEIARDIGAIKLFLRSLNVSSDDGSPVSRSTRRVDQGEPPNSIESTSMLTEKPLWDHSAQMIDFVKAVLEHGTSRTVEPGENEVLSSLGKLLHALEDPASARDLYFPNPKTHRPLTGSTTMPPLEAVVSVLRWAKEHASFTRITWLSHLLPLEDFTDICRKVYFAIDEYSEVDFILANGYLSYVFNEYLIANGLNKYREYCQVCRENLHSALSQLPLLLPASAEVVAALTLGTFNAVENSKTTLAWKFISTAIELCQTLGYHRLRPGRDNDQALQTVEERLFWAVYGIEKGLSLRLGRASNIRDSEVTLPTRLDETRYTKLGRINGMIYDQLYSVSGLSGPDDERSLSANTLANAIRGIINETTAEISVLSDEPNDQGLDSMRAVYLRCDLVCQHATLALILRAIPTTLSSRIGEMDECAVAARNALDMHERCMEDLRICKHDTVMVAKYINWAILYCPFVPFSILFTRAVQLSDYADLARLDRFAASLQPEKTLPEAITHPYRLYTLLCQAARLYLGLDTPVRSEDPTLVNPWSGFELEDHGTEARIAMEETLNGEVSQEHELYDWCQDSQQLMGLLGDDIMF